jgi:hypothetical protein
LESFQITWQPDALPRSAILHCTTPPTATRPIFPLSIGSTATPQAVVVSEGVPPVTTGVSWNDFVAASESLEVGVISTPVIATTAHRANVVDALQYTHV